MTMIHSPLEQFEVTPVWSLALGETLAFTNTAFFGLIVMFAIFSILSFGTKNATVVPNRWQTLVFDFAKEVEGTSPLNFNYHYDKAIIYFNYGVDGATAGQKTYYFDDMLFLTSSAQVDQDEFMDLIKPYPNPTINKIHINNPAGMPLLVKIIDESGRNLKVITSTNADVEIPMEKYAAGCYTLFIQNKINNRIVTRRIIKQ